MSDKTGIQWTDATWNPVSGCSKVSPGCKNCYAERDWSRLSKNPKSPYFGRAFTDVKCHPERLEQPLRWRRPRRIFVNSMSDLFHEDVPLEFIQRVFNTMWAANWHTYQILTKRPQRMREILEPGVTCLKNVWLGVSVENPEQYESRASISIHTPAAVRFLSMEPLIEAVISQQGHQSLYSIPTAVIETVGSNGRTDYPTKIDWVIAGGESGPHARPCNVEWIRSIVRQCEASRVPVFVKQLGANPDFRVHELDWGASPLFDRHGGDPAEWPEDLRVPGVSSMSVRKMPSELSTDPPCAYRLEANEARATFASTLRRLDGRGEG